MSVRYENTGDVAHVTIDRADRLNAIDAATEVELERIWTSIESDDAIRVVILTGAGERAFCVGADMKTDPGLTGLEYWAGSNINGFGGIALRESLKIPVIARVNGLALGGGMEMVLGCDIVVAADSAKFGLPEPKVGRLPLDGGMVKLQRLIPENIAAGMMLSGRMLSAADAAHFGLANSVVPIAQLDAEVDSWVADIVSCAPLSVVAIKHTIRNTRHLSLREAQAMRSPQLIAALNSEDSNEGVTAFREKRAPVWKGR